VGKAGQCECILEDGPDRTSVAPVLAVEARYLELAVIPKVDFGRRKERIVQVPEFLLL
jgi:hypothetical protein